MTRTLRASDEFDGAAHGVPNPAMWAIQTGSNPANGELQTYTDKSSNICLTGDGKLNITARKEIYTGSDGITKNYTSGRLYSQAELKYGYLEVKALLPSGQGLWPAIWTCGSDMWGWFPNPWPQCGEIDILESVNTMTTASGNLHGPKKDGTAYGFNVNKKPVILAGQWHLYAIDWTTDYIAWLIDGIEYGRILKTDVQKVGTWEFDKPHRIRMNLAVGGNWPGSPDTSTPFPATMLVDYVRYYN